MKLIEYIEKIIDIIYKKIQKMKKITPQELENVVGQFNLKKEKESCIGFEYDNFYIKK